VAIVMVVALVLPLIVRRPALPGPVRFEPDPRSADFRTRA
jgi:hypothetical protein